MGPISVRLRRCGVSSASSISTRTRWNGLLATAQFPPSHRPHQNAPRLQDQTMTITLEVPDNISFQMVYRMERRTPFDVALEPELRFAFLHSTGDGIASFRDIATQSGRLAAVKSV